MADVYDGMRDRWPVNHQPVDNPRIAFAVTGDSNLDLPNSSGTPSYAKALYNGTAAQDIQVIMAGDKSAGGQGTPVTFKAVPIGFMNIQVRRVLGSPTNLLALMD